MEQEGGGQSRRTRKPPHRVEEAAEGCGERAGSAAEIAVTALPWAEVFIDGTRQGVSPPLKRFPAKAGQT